MGGAARRAKSGEARRLAVSCAVPFGYRRITKVNFRSFDRTRRGDMVTDYPAPNLNPDPVVTRVSPLSVTVSFRVTVRLAWEL